VSESLYRIEKEARRDLLFVNQPWYRRNPFLLHPNPGLTFALSAVAEALDYLAIQRVMIHAFIRSLTAATLPGFYLYSPDVL
jgi:hypothetical protein